MAYRGIAADIAAKKRRMKRDDAARERRQIAASIDKAVQALKDQIDSDILEAAMAWTTNALWEVRCADVIRRFALNPILKVTPENFLLFMGEADDPTFAKSKRWRSLKKVILATRKREQAIAARTERASVEIQNARLARENIKTNAQMIARYTAPPENTPAEIAYNAENQQWSEAESAQRLAFRKEAFAAVRQDLPLRSLIPRADVISGWVRVTQEPKPKPQPMILGAKRAYFND